MASSNYLICIVLFCILARSQAQTEAETTQTEAETIQTEAETTQTDPVETTTEGPSNGCPAEGFKLIPHPERCEKFFYCLNGNIIDEGECASELYFDPELEKCNLKELVDCANPEDPTTTTTTTTAPLPSCPPTGIISLPYPGNCSLYILCVNGAPILSQCARGTLFDPITLRCRPAEEVDCDAVPGALLVEKEIMQKDSKDSFYCPGGEEFTKMPIINDCQSWYECKKGKKTKSASKKCPREQFFSFENQSCVLSKPKYCL